MFYYKEEVNVLSEMKDSMQGLPRGYILNIQHISLDILLKNTTSCQGTVRNVALCKNAINYHFFYNLQTPYIKPIMFK
ncbi:hypothetical protein XELAEV_18020063mg [Xenopus laevis]|uniref:Uncharacterized protein n=1 Tax=Xenopus laevis TaxID=8355 RepID=A0A974D8P1_XENLA|nr:hypothetical protein XELAEV_18020063mg [Xenopus laevis]